MDNPLITGRRGLCLVELIGGRRGGLSFSELSAALEISSASLSRLLKMLCAEDWIRQGEPNGRYIAGPRLLQLGDDMRSHSPGIDIVARVIYDLANETRHSACFASFKGDHFILVAKTELRRSYHFIDIFTPNLDWIGNGMGQFLLAYQTPDHIKRIYRQQFRMEVPDEHWECFAAIRKTGTFGRNESFVTRVIAGVETEPGARIENLVAVAALGSDAPDIGELQPLVRQAAALIEQRLRMQGVSIDSSAIKQRTLEREQA